MRTPWGYEIKESMDPLLSEERFHTITNNAFAGNQRVGQALLAASQVIRNYCGWHICPSMDCEAEPMGDGNVRRLPAGYVSEIEDVYEKGEITPSLEYEWRENGLIRKNGCGRWATGWKAVKVVYKAGYEIEAVPDLAEAVAAITAGVLSVTAGVTSESADGVSISYSASASSIAAALTSQQKSALEPYKVVSSHAA